MIPQTQKIILPNGLTVLFHEDHRMPIVSLALWVKVGSVNEDETTNGLSHFLEHMVFKGTKKYPGNALSYAVEDVGGMMNAATSMDTTHYYLELLSKEVSLGFSVLSEIACNARFDAQELERERGVVLEEIVRGKDNADHVLWETAYDKIFSNHPYSLPIIGTKENISSFGVDDFKRYYETHYTPENMALIVAGNISNQELTAYLEKYFYFLPQTQKNNNEIEVFNPKLTSNSYIEQTMRTIHEAHFTYAWHIPGITDDDFYSLEIAAHLLGKGISSRLYRILKEKHHLVWGISSDLVAQSKGSLFVVNGISDSKNISEIEKRLLGVMGSLWEGSRISNEELEKVKHMVRTDFWNDVETVSERASMLGYYEMMSDYRMMYDVLDSIAGISTEKASHAAEKYFSMAYTSVVLKPKG